MEPPLFRSKNGIIVDQYDRQRMFRGVNLAGTKVPYAPNGETRFSGSLDPRGVTFTGRPFLDDEADEHFSRLSSIGCNLIRWNLTWEAVENKEPGVYDEDFLAYLRRLLVCCEKYGISVFIDPHQDVWSRWTGGDGAPVWTLQKCGFDITKLCETGAAFTHQDQGESYEDMTWQLNYGRYACATMFTLFWAGSVFAPKLLIDGMNADEFLQSHFINAMAHTARRIKDCKAVIGFGVLNEPHPGYVGIKDLSEIPQPNAAKGLVMSPFESMKAASGLGGKARRFVALPRGFKLLETLCVPPVVHGAFLPGFSCPWRLSGVWDADASGISALLRKDYFSRGVKSFASDFYKPFQKRFIAAMEKKHEHYLFFLENAVDGSRPSWGSDEPERAKIVDAFHWYDPFPLLFKKWSALFSLEADTRAIVLGREKVRASFVSQLKRSAEAAREEGIPLLLGEFGFPFDLYCGESFITGDYSKQSEALDAYYSALDELLLSCTLWNYTAYNTHKGGDGWNKEDLSIYCAEDKRLRAQKAYCRPFVAACAGKLIRVRFTHEGFKRNDKAAQNAAFEVEWESRGVPSGDLSRATEIFVPDVWFPRGWRVDRADFAGAVIPQSKEQRLYVITEKSQRCVLRIVDGI
jgi:hypothetical protein